jgi:tetratricopeptide (TPR) repeat protein
MGYKNRKALAWALNIVLLSVLLTACSGKEERQAKYLQRAQQYFEKGNYDKARVEAKNVLQINANNAEARYVFAEIAEQEGNWQQVYAELSAALENDPKMLKARVKLAQLFVFVNQIDEAIAQANKIKEQDPNSPDYFSVSAGIAMRQKNTDEAIKDAQKALELKPGHIGATAILSAIYSDTDPAKAEQVVAEGIRFNPEQDDLRLLQVQGFAKQNKVEQAIAGLKELIKRNPNKLSYVSHLVNYYVQQHRVSDAEALFNQSIKEKPENTDLKLAFAAFLATQHTPADGLAQLAKYVAAEPNNYKLRSKLAQAYLSTKDPEKAIATYQFTIDKDVKGEGIDARNRVVDILLSQNKRPEAEALLKDILKLEPENTDGLITRARLELADNNPDAGIADLRAVLKNAPDSRQALLLLAAAQERSGATGLALDNYNKVLRTNGNDLLALLGAAKLDIATNQLDEAKKLLEHARTVDGKNIDVSRMLVNLYVRSQQWQPAFDLCDQLIQDAGTAAVGYYLKGLVQLDKRDIPASIESLKKSLETEPRAIEPLLALVSVYVRTKQLGTAITYLESHVSAHPDQPHGKEMLGGLYRQVGKLDRAEAVLTEVVSQQPPRIAAYRELLTVYSLLKQPEKSALLLDQGLQKNPANVDLMLLRAQIFLASAQYKDALALYEKALVLQPKSQLIRNNLAAVLIERFPDEANLRRAQTLTTDFADSKNPMLIDTLAWLQYKMKNYPQAVSLLESVLAKNIDAPEIRYHLGMAYLRNGKPDKAKVELAKATADKAEYFGRDEAEMELKKL